MALTYTQSKAILDDIAQRSEQNRKTLEQARELISQAGADLSFMASYYGPFVAELDLEALNNPDNSAWQNAKAEKDQMVVDFNNISTRATALLAAVDSIP